MILGHPVNLLQTGTEDLVFPICSRTLGHFAGAGRVMTVCFARGTFTGSRNSRTFVTSWGKLLKTRDKHNRQSKLEFYYNEIKNIDKIY